MGGCFLFHLHQCESFVKSRWEQRIVKSIIVNVSYRSPNLIDSKDPDESGECLWNFQVPCQYTYIHISCNIKVNNGHEIIKVVKRNATFSFGIYIKCWLRTILCTYWLKLATHGTGFRITIELRKTVWHRINNRTLNPMATKTEWWQLSRQKTNPK